MMLDDLGVRALAAAATGVSVTRRQLYTDSVLLSMPTTAALAVTTRTAAFAQRPDIVERVLPIFVGDLPDGERRSETDLLADVERERNGVLSYLAGLGATCLRDAQHAPAGLPCRFQDFARLCWALSEETVQADLAAWRQAQTLAVCDLDPLAEAIMTYLPDDGLRGSASDIIKTLSERGADLPYLGGGKAIARRLRELAPTLRAAGIAVLEQRDEFRHIVLSIYRR